MKVVPKYSPQESCGLKPLARVRVVRNFTSLEAVFAHGDELVFLREMFDRDMGCDVWVFGTDESRRIEDSLPEDGIIGGRYLWHELVHHKHIHGLGEFQRPSSWLSNLELFAR